MAEAARQAAAELDGERIEILEGDIAERRLGLADADWERLTAEVTSAFHLAAIYNLAVPLEIAQRVNVDGTGNVLELCAACERLGRLNYVSTAYVAGVRTGVVYEHELALGQSFKNHYESTKFQAEVWVREAMDAVADDDLQAGDRRGRLPDGRDAEVRRARTTCSASSRSRSSAGRRSRSSAGPPRRSTWCRSTSSWTR